MVAAVSISYGWNQSTMLVIIFVTLISLGVWRDYHRGKHHKIVLNKETNNVETYGLSFFGRAVFRTYALDQFNAVQSYNIGGRGARTVVELLDLERKRGLVLNQFLPGGGKKFLTLAIETENPLAEDLAKQVSTFLSIENLGFTGQKMLATTPVSIEDDADLLKQFLH